ncbi:MAG: chorismate mutase [Clostridia bacterium]|nr:chorismate mutase [Clostridia bacterium]
MTKLDDSRQRINDIDKQMAKLFEERLAVAKDIAEYKIQHGLPVLDKQREKELIEKNSSYITDEIAKEYYINYITNTLDISKKYQSRLMQGIKVAYSGVEGAFAHIAAKKMFPNATYISFGDFSKAFNATVDGTCDVCVLPLENSYAGDVGLVMDLIFSGSLYINQVYELEVVHNLLAKKGTTLKDIKTVISHPQALSQCHDYISQNNFKSLEAQNTAIAAKLVSEGSDKSLAAIASSENAQLYNLEILQTRINTSNNNTTRFGAFSRCTNKTKPAGKTGENSMIMFTVKNEAGALAQTLNIIGSHKFNMKSLHSRPMKELMWQYYFYIELEGNINTGNGEKMLEEMLEYCDKLKVVGTYLANNK